ncbi:MAG: hydrogenase iron-sulfur subunit [Persicimonas sp.]
METPIKIQDAQPEPPVRGEGFWRALENLFLYADRAVEKLVPARLNPLAQTGALANVSFLIALVSGVLLLFWYVPSVQQAWESLEQMGWLGRFMRSLHRYSSDATMFFVIVHALRMLVSRRFNGARWVPWVTGIVLVGMLWFVGWLGYWLVWDVRAQTLAVGSAKVLEVLPIFTEPMSRSFLTDGGVSTGLFFMVFFFHMLLPLAMGIALWMHISRVSRAKFLTSRPMTLWLVAVTMVVSILFPALSADKAEMAVHPQAFTADWWYLLPMAITERLSGGALIWLTLVGSIVAVAVPWWMTRKTPKKAVVDTNRCNGCARCVEDCPYDAIIMVPREDGHPRYEIQAEVDPGKCVGCGICAGACNPGGIGLPQMPVQDKRKQVDGWIDEMLERDGRAFLAFLCSNSAAADFSVDEDGRCPELAGYRVVPVPCAGWVQALSLERALRRGAEAILIVGCAGGDPPYREGVKWTGMRLEGEREPKLRREKLRQKEIDPSTVRFVTYNRTEKDELIEAARRLREGVLDEQASAYSAAKKYVGGLVLAAALAVPVVALSDAPSLVPTETAPELVVSVKHRPNEVGDCRDLTDAEKSGTMAHMQARDGKICERRRPDVRVSVWLDDEQVVDTVYEAHGLSSDGPGIGTERFQVEPGKHDVAVRVGNTAQPDQWSDEWTGSFEFEEGRKRVVLFENKEGFVVE